MKYAKVLELLSDPVSFTPEEVAELFCNLNCQGMCEFFTEIARISDKWANGGFPMQMQYVKDSEYSTLEGRHIMRTIGEYGE